MKAWRILAVIVLVLAALSTVLSIEGWRQGGGEPGGQGGVVVAVTFPSLLEDVEALLCPGDRAFAVVPSGVDPHSYSLSVDDVERLRSADVIVSTAHTGFELQIRRMVEDGELGAVLIELPRLPGVRILANPSTGQPNYHMPVYDPYNYRVFMNTLAATLSARNPRCSSHYMGEAARILEPLENITGIRLNCTAVATTPLAQYAVEWAGVRIKYLYVKEHGVPATSRDIEDIEDAASRGEIGCVIIVEGSPSQVVERARNLAERHGLPIIEVPSPMSKGLLRDKILTIAGELRALSQR